MKVIELLNKIANGEEVPEYINYIHRALGKDTMLVCSENIINKLDQGAIELNDEVEIIEEPQEHKIPKKLGVCAYEEGEISYSWSKSEAVLKTKINEIIDCLEENK